MESWDGVTRTLKNVGGCPQNGALSPDGSWIASTEVIAGSQGGCTGQNNVYLLGRNDNVRQTSALGAPEGWIDSGHLVVTAQPGEPSAARSILDVSSNAVVQLSAVGFFAGSLPGGLGYFLHALTSPSVAEPINDFDPVIGTWGRESRLPLHLSSRYQSSNSRG